MDGQESSALDGRSVTESGRRRYKKLRAFRLSEEKKRKKLSVILVVLSGFLSEFSFAFYLLL